MIPAPFDELPPELRLLAQLTDDDDRPTVVLDGSNTVFWNRTFEYVLARAGKDALKDWLSIELRQPVSNEAKTTSRFAEREWIKKKLGKSYIVVYCKHDFIPIHHESPHVESERLDHLLHDWIRHPTKVPINDWERFLLGYDWSETAIGARSGPHMRDWPAQLREIMITFMHCPQPRIIYWGHDLIQFYNASAAKLHGKRHPAALGNGLADSWGHELYEQTVDTIKASWQEGQSIHTKEKMLLIDRDGYIEEAYFDWFLLPFTGHDGNWICSVNCFNERTPHVLQKNREEVLQKLTNFAAQAPALSELWPEVLGILDEDSDDVSFALMYTVSERVHPTEDDQYHLHGSAGLNTNTAFAKPSTELIQAFQTVQEEESVMLLSGETFLAELGVTFSELGTVNFAYVFPIFDTKGNIMGFFILGVNPRRYANDEMTRFVVSLNETLLKAVMILESPVEQRKLLMHTDNTHIQLERLSRQLSVAKLKNEKNQETFGRMAENAPIGIFLYLADGTPVFTNDQFLALLGETREDYYEKAKTGFAWRDCIHPDDEELAKSAWASAVQTRSTITIQFRVKAGTKSSPMRARWLEVVVSPHHGADGTLETLQGYLTDVTARKLTEALTDERMNAAIETKRASENFIDMVSHEMRNPLSSILQLAEVVLTTLPDDLPAEVHDTLADAAHTINICALHQKTIIDEVLTFSKLDSNLLVLAPERTKPHEIVEKALKMFETELSRVDIQSCIRQMPNDCAVGEVLCDPGRLLQVIINLLTNAIKFTKASDRRSITLSYGCFMEAPSAEDCAVTFIQPRRKDHEEPGNVTKMLSSANSDDDTDDVYLCFSVEDSGIGLTPEESQLLFQRFSQAPKTYKQYGGSGLGLFISRELCELMNGQIGLHSESGVGSRFAFYIKGKRAIRVSRSGSVASVESAISVRDLPKIANSAFAAVKVVEKVDVVQSAASSVKDMHILIVEDNEINRKVMSQQLRKLGCKVYTAENGLEALNHWSKTIYSPTGETPLSLILLDIEMPVMDGLTCIRRIRQLEESGAMIGHVPVIAITANARPEQVASAIEAGMDEVVTKPFKIRDLVPRMEFLVASSIG